MSRHDEIVECIRKVYGLSGKQKEVDGFVDIAEDQKFEVELSGKPEKLTWAMLKLSKDKHGTLFVLPKHLEKALKYKESYRFDKIEIKTIPEECL
jgi:acylphosphatase